MEVSLKMSGNHPCFLVGSFASLEFEAHLIINEKIQNWAKYFDLVTWLCFHYITKNTDLNHMFMN